MTGRIYHYKDLPPKAFTEQPPAGYDITIELMKACRNNPAGLAVAALSVGYFIGRAAAADE